MLNLLFRYPGRSPFLADESHGARNVQHSKSVLRRVYLVDKNIAWEQGDPYLLFAVLPATEDLSHRQEDFDAPVRQLAQHLLLKAAPRIQSVPIGTNYPVIFALFQDRISSVVISSDSHLLKVLKSFPPNAMAGGPVGLNISSASEAVKRPSVSICIFESSGLRGTLIIAKIGGFVATAVVANAFDSDSIEMAAQVIKEGGLVAFPTETVYGLGADVGNPLAVARIFEVKARPRIDPVIVHVSDPASAGSYGIFPDIARRLMEHFWPGALTLVVDKTPAVPPIVTAGLDTVAIRVPSHPAALALIRAAGCGIAAPSANAFGYTSPTTAQHVAEHLREKIDLILDGGPCSIGVESTILSLTGAIPRVLRAGGISVEDLSAMIGELEVSIGTEENPEVPGQMRRHYATRTPLSVCEQQTEQSRFGERVGLLTLSLRENPERYAAVEVLSRRGDLREAAANFFGALRRLDNLSLDRIVARPIPEVGLGLALMDRLRRASATE